MGVLNDGIEVETQEPEGTPTDGQPAGGGSPQQGVESPKWKAQVRDDLKQNEVLDQYGDLNALADAHLELLNGKSDEVTVPADDDSEAWEKFYEKLRPTEKSKYELTTETEFKGAEEFTENFKEAAYNAGLSQKQAQDVFGYMAGQIAEGNKQLEEMGVYTDPKKTDATLREEWGDQYETNVNNMKNGIRKFASKDFIEFLDKTGLSNNPEMCKVFAQIGATMAEDQPANNDQGPVLDIPFSYPSMKE